MAVTTLPRTVLNLSRHFGTARDLMAVTAHVVRRNWPAHTPFHPDVTAARDLAAFGELLAAEMPLFSPGRYVDPELAGRLAGLALHVYDLCISAKGSAPVSADIAIELVDFILFDAGYSQKRATTSEFRLRFERYLSKRTTWLAAKLIRESYEHYLL